MNSLNWHALDHAWPYLLDGLYTTALLTGVGLVLGIALGTVLAVSCMYAPKPLARVARWYTDVFRSIPLILTLFWVYFLVPQVLRTLTGNPYLDVGPVYAALTAFVLAEAAYFGEIIRGGLMAVPAGQIHAATALGMGQITALRLIILPQAIRHMAPSLVNQSIGLLMDTSLVYVISLNDFLGAATKVAQRDGTVVEVYLFVAACYLAVCSAGSALVAWLRRRNSGSVAR